jgi:hypothetical protein
MARGCTVLVRLAATLFVGLAITACSGEKGGDVAADPGSTAAGTGALAPATTVNRCPLTAEQVSAAVGAQVKGPDSTCSFFPADEDNVRPNAAYVPQVSFACSGKTPAENDYSETLAGLEQPAYIADRFDGTWILVCRSGAPFEIRVDLSGNEAARAAATALARQVLAAR